MKSILAILLFSSFLLGQPSYLKDAEVSVTLKNGKTYTYSSNEYKVVPRVQEKIKKEKPKLKHSVALLGGRAKTDMEVYTKKTTVYSQEEYEPVWGIEYRITHPVGFFVEIGALSNNTVFTGWGMEF